MVCHWVIGLLVLSGFSYVSGEDNCDPVAATVCYEELLHYETIAFPLYGEDKARLEETCLIINSSYDCLDQFMSYCSEKTAECDEECQILMQDVKSFTKFRVLENLYGVLCSPESVLSTTYVENVDCLYSIADSYASCHNDSQKSLHYLITSTQTANLESRCCFFKWYEECFINATSEHCGDNATFFVYSATHTMMGNLAKNLCFGVESTCMRPPMPSEDNDATEEGQNEEDDSEVVKCLAENEEFVYECIEKGTTEVLALMKESGQNMYQDAATCTRYALVASCFVDKIKEKCGEEAASLAETEFKDMPADIKKSCEASEGFIAHKFELLSGQDRK